MSLANFHTGISSCIRKHLLCLLFAILSGCWQTAFAYKYPIQNFTPSDYKAGIQNIGFAQNRDMTLFVANNLGVLSYNGHDWKTYAYKTGKKQRSLAFDEMTNRLYYGSQGDFGYFDADWNQVSLTAKVPVAARNFDEVWDVYLLHSKTYFCTFQGIYIYEGQGISVVERPGGFTRSFLANGKLFVQGKEGVIFELNDGKLQAPSFLQNGIGTVAGILPHDGGHLVVYNSGKIQLANAYGTREHFLSLSNALQGKYVNHVLQLSDTRLVISTQTAGLFLFDWQDQSIENITAKNGLLTNACLRTFQDFGGNLWVGMQNGIALVAVNSPMRFTNQEINLEGSGYEVYEGAEGTYFTTSNGIYFLGKNAVQSLFLNGTEGPAYGMQRIAGKLYAGHHTGLFLLENGQARRLAEIHGLWQVKPLQSRPDYAVGGAYDGLYLFQLGTNGELQVMRKIEGFDESSRFFEEDQKGRIWVGQYYKGLYQLSFSEDLSRATVRKISGAEGLPVDEQLILSRIDNELYLATPKGVFKIEQQSDRIVKAALFSEIIGEQQVRLLVQDNQKNIHVHTDNLVGFYRQISTNNYAFVPSSLFQLRYSFNNDLLNVSVNVKGGVFFNANEGFIQYQPERENIFPSSNPPLVNPVFSVAEGHFLYARQPFEKKPEVIAPLVVSSRAKVLQFGVEAFQFIELSNQQFRYFLKGFDEGYSDWTLATTKEYTNLREGDYEFFVQTQNHLGQTVTSQPLLIKVKPPLHRSLFAKLLYVALGILALLLVSRRQKRRYHHKALAAEAAQQQELAQKQQELLEIERQKAEELRHLEEDKMKSELRHLNNLLAASTMNLVVKNEFMETIKEELKVVRSRGKSEETKQALEKIVKEIDTTLRLQEDWEQFEHHFDQVHGDFLHRLRSQFHDLSSNEQKLCVFLRLNLNTKDIANLMGVSLRGVEIARYRLRKKLGLGQGENLSKYILEY